MSSRATWDETQRAERNGAERKERVQANHASEDLVLEGFEKRAKENHEAEEDAADNQGDWKLAHAALSRFAKARARMDWEEAQLLLWTQRSGCHARLGYATFPEYVERLLGYGPRFALEKVRVAEALERLPELRQALKNGDLNWSVLRELTRVAMPQTEREWREVAGGKSAREIERLVSGRRPGDRPSDGPDPRLKRHVLRFDVSGETLAVFRDALARIRRATSGPLDDDGSLMLMARQVLGGPRDEGRASYQVQLMVCESCGRGEQLGKGERIPIGPEIVAMCQCDAQHVGAHHLNTEKGGVLREYPQGPEHVHGHGAPELSDQSVSEWPSADMPSADMPNADMPNADMPNAESPNTMPSPPTVARTSAVRALQPRSPRLGTTTRATQPISPALRRAVMLRDGGRCVVPGCRNAVFVDVHHLRPRHEQGPNELDNLCCACVAHHRAIHHGTLLVEGGGSSGLRFRHADGMPYGGAVSTEVAELGSQVFQALTGLAFRETDARHAIRQSLTHVGPAPSMRMREELFRRSVQLLSEQE